MPNRVIREGILDSERVDKLTWPAEVFYRRLMSIVDDFGRGDGRISIIRSKCYPLKLEKVSIADVTKWMNECSEAGLLSAYEVQGKPYIELLDFRQSLRKMKSSYPNKDGSFETKEQYLARMHANDSNGDQLHLESNQNRNESELKPEKHSLIDFFFQDFPNSSYLDKVVKAMLPINATITEVQRKKEELIIAIPDFRKAANLDYGNMLRFAEHFKNWYLKVYSVQNKTIVSKRQRRLGS